MKIRLEFNVPNDEVDSKSDLDAAVAFVIRCWALDIEQQSIDGLPEYTYEDQD